MEEVGEGEREGEPQRREGEEVERERERVVQIAFWAVTRSHEERPTSCLSWADLPGPVGLSDTSS